MMADYSQIIPRILDEPERTRVGKQLLAIAKDCLAEQLKTAKVLDVGCAGGTITALFATEATQVIGIDPDKTAIEFARRHYRRKNLRFEVADALKLPWGDERFDLVICNQVYEFVPSDEKLMREIHRVLKPGGVCLFGAANRWVLIEPQYRLPLLSWFPPKAAQVVLALIRPGTKYVGRYRGYFSLRQLIKKFEIIDYTPRILADPPRFGFSKLAKIAWLTKIGAIFYPLIAALVPNYLWILRKPNQKSP